MEYYGHNDSQIISTWHVWKVHPDQSDQGEQTIVAVPPGSLSAQFHTYGVEVTPGEVRFISTVRKAGGCPRRPATAVASIRWSILRWVRAGRSRTRPTLLPVGRLYPRLSAQARLG
jgi:hypothetical protein